MKIVNTEMGRVIRLFPMEEVRPPSGVHPPTALRMVAERYGFTNTPEMKRSWEESQKDGLKFQLGKLEHQNGAINIADFTIYNDGLVATTATTEETDIFLDDLLNWGREEFGYREVNRNTLRTLYLSTVVADFEYSPDALLKTFSVLSESFAALLHTTYGIDIPVQISRLGLNFDRTVAIPAWQTLSQFVMERRINQPYPMNRFYCEAPLRTKDHFAFLETVESILNPGGLPSQKKVKR